MESADNNRAINRSRGATKTKLIASFSLRCVCVERDYRRSLTLAPENRLRYIIVCRQRPVCFIMS